MTQQKIPDEEQIAALLANVQPQPGPHLRERVARATWAQARPEPARPAFSWLTRRMAVSILVIFGVIAALFAVPPFNGVARRVANFFYRADQETISIPAQPPSRDFPLSPREAAAQAGFAVQLPGHVPEGFRLNGAVYAEDRQSVLIDYHSPIPGKFLRLSQSLTSANRLDVSSIGPAADVQTVEIQTDLGESSPGEYVAGAWRIPAMLEHLQNGQPDLTATMQATWDPDAKIHMLRWESGGFIFEIIHADPNLEMLSADLLVKIAESMK